MSADALAQFHEDLETIHRNDPAAVASKLIADRFNAFVAEGRHATPDNADLDSIVEAEAGDSIADLIILVGQMKALRPIEPATVVRLYPGRFA